MAGDQRETEKQTLVWDRTNVDRTAELREWVRFPKPIRGRGLIIYVYANKHYAGFAHETVRLFNQYLLEGKLDTLGTSRA
jgi:hypothetical protein